MCLSRGRHLAGGARSQRARHELLFAVPPEQLTDGDHELLDALVGLPAALAGLGHREVV